MNSLFFRLFIWVFLVWCSASAYSQQAAGLKQVSTAALLECFSDHKCGQDYRAVSSELSRRKPTRLLITSYWKTTDQSQKDGIFLALHGIDAPEVAQFMKSAIKKESLDEDDLYYANDYLGERCDLRALRFLSGSGAKKYFQLAACPDWARTVAYFGKCQYRQAIPFLIASLDSQCLDIGDAAAKALSQLFPDAPKRFASPEAIKEYFSKQRVE